MASFSRGASNLLKTGGISREFFERRVWRASCVGKSEGIFAQMIRRQTKTNKEKKDVNLLRKTMLLMAGLAALSLAPAAKADEWDQKTTFTFHGPVEIPGQVLPAGTYVFKLANSGSNRNIVQVFNKEESRVFATILAIPDYRLRASEKTIITFDERAGDAPDAIKAWFYPGRTHGHEFVYPKNEALALAKANHTPVPSMPVELTPETLKSPAPLNGPVVTALNAAPLKAEEPGGNEVELAAAFAVADPQAATTPSPLPERLPETATELPLLGLAGLLSLGTALTLRLAARQR